MFAIETGVINWFCLERLKPWFG